MKNDHRPRMFQRNSARIIFVGVVVILGFFFYIFWDLPSLDALPETFMTPSVRITDRNDRLLYEILPQEGGRNTVLSIENIPQCLKDATIAVEDKNFYTNPGFDLTGIIRALWINLKGGETVAGGSTRTTSTRMRADCRLAASARGL